MAIGLLTSAACGPNYIKGTKVESTPEREEIAGIVEQYRNAMQSRDVAALRTLASRNYYENGSTTDDPNDDYDTVGLDKVFGDLKDKVKAVKYEIDIEEISVIDDIATVVFEYRTQYLYTAGEQDRWGTHTDRNRLSLRREGDDWRIISGM